MRSHEPRTAVAANPQPDPVLSALCIFTHQFSHSIVRERLSNLLKVTQLEGDGAALQPKQVGSCRHCLSFTLSCSLKDTVYSEKLQVEDGRGARVQAKRRIKRLRWLGPAC